MFDTILTAPLVTATSSCANLLMEVTNTGGIIQSSESGDYSNNMDCQWNISSNTVLELVFLRFNTQTSTDVVRVYNGRSSSTPLIATYSGSSLPAPIISATNNLYVTFTSDASGEVQGFRARYRGRMLVKYI